jgi:trans-2,3-dihydro-3-hydroxyanthranilate isomerase
METMKVPFVFVDVFAARPPKGNPVSVVPDADALDLTTIAAHRP